MIGLDAIAFPKIASLIYTLASLEGTPSPQILEVFQIGGGPFRSTKFHCRILVFRMALLVINFVESFEKK